MRVGAIVLAAGASVRMGQPKQLLRVQGTTLLQRAMQSAASAASPIVVVLGHQADRIKGEVLFSETDGCTVVVNQEWREGIASSIRCGVAALLDADPDTEGALIVLADQPLVQGSDLIQLVTRFSEGSKPIVAAAFADTVGPPAIFARAIFPELLELRGDHGAKRIISADPSRVIPVPLPQAAVDIDTPEQYQKVLPEVESASRSRRNE